MDAPPSITQLIEGSGNNFHAKVARWFAENGWNVSVSPYYMDQSQSKAREIDLVVERLSQISDDFGRLKGYVVVRLFVECKFIVSESVFWFAPKDMPQAGQLVCRLAGLNQINSYSQSHHYISKCLNVAKVFASNNSRAAENEPFYRALNQALGAAVAMRRQKSAHPALRGKSFDKLVILEYPVIICSSFASLYAVDFLSNSEPRRVTENFQMEVEYTFLDRSGNHRNEYFLIDVIDFENLSDYQSAVVTGADAVAYLSSD